MRKQFLSELIDGKILIVHAAKDTNIIIKESEIEQAQNNQVQTILQQNSITLPVLEQELKEKYGMSLAKFKAQMRMQIQEQLVRKKCSSSMFLRFRQAGKIFRLFMIRIKTACRF